MRRGGAVAVLRDLWERCSSREVVGGTVALVIYAGALGAFSLAAAERIRTDSLRQTAVSLAGLALIPAAWVVGAAAGRTAQRWPLRVALVASASALAVFGALVVGAAR